jgi:hypothetical protein
MAHDEMSPGVSLEVAKRHRRVRGGCFETDHAVLWPFLWLFLN